MVCNKCNEDKSVNDFNFKNKKIGIKHKTCKICVKNYRKGYYDKNKENALKCSKVTTLEIRARNRQYIWDLLSNKECIDCGESDPIVLDFDHRDVNEKEHNISDMILSCYSLDNINNEIKKCDIRCANCHRRRTAKQFDWYKEIVK
jgi:hypothetical protein